MILSSKSAWVPTAAPASRTARTYVNHCMIIVRILLLDILMIVSRVGCSREWRGGDVRPHDLSRRRACDTDTLNDVVLGIIFCFEFDSILKLCRVGIFMYRNCIY